MKLNNVIFVNLGEARGALPKHTCIASNFSAKEIQKAFKDGAELLHFNILDIAGRSSKMTASEYTSLMETKFEPSDEFMSDGNLDIDDVIEVFFFTVKTGDSQFAYAEIEYHTLSLAIDPILEIVH